MTPLQRSSNEHNIAVLGSRVVLAAEELSARGRCRVSRGDVRWVYDDSGTEELFVTLGAPSRLGVAALTVITKSGGIDATSRTTAPTSGSRCSATRAE